MSGAALNWASTDTSIAVVSPTGVVRGVRPGVATLTVQSGGSMSATAVSVRAPRAAPPTVQSTPASPATPAVASVNIVAPVETLGVGGLTRLRATPQDAAGRAVGGQAFAWTSSAPRVASVGDDGTVTAQGAGSVTITATTAGVSRSVKLTVLPGPVPAARDTMVPAPAAAATPVPPAPHVPSAEETRQSITNALQAFSQAVASRDLARLRRAYPGMTAPEEQAYRELFGSGGRFDFTLTSGTPSIQDTTAVVTGTARYHYSEPRELEQVFNYRAVLDGSSGTWRLSSIAFAQQ